MASSEVRKRPKLLVFDLDYTLWPFWVDCHVEPPFKKKSNGDVIDSILRKIEHYPDVPEVLHQLHKEGYTLAIASRTGAPKDAQSLLDLFGWNKYFSYKEMYPGGKKTHFSRIQKDSGIEYKDMIFFDDEPRNIRDISHLGVLAVRIYEETGTTKMVVKEALEEFSKR